MWTPSLSLGTGRSVRVTGPECAAQLLADTKARQILRLSGFAPGAIPSDVVRVLEHANVPRHCIARGTLRARARRSDTPVFPRLKPDLTPASRPLDFFVILNWDEKFFRFKFRDLPRPVEGEFLPTAGQDAVAPPELIANSGSIRALEAALNPDRALVGSYAGRSVRLGNIRRRLDRGTILHHLAETFGVHGIIPRLMPEGATAPLEPIVALPRCVFYRPRTTLNFAGSRHDSSMTATSYGSTPSQRHSRPCGRCIRRRGRGCRARTGTRRRRTK